MMAHDDALTIETMYPRESRLKVLAQRIENHHAKVAVMGLGYVGLPLVIHLLKAGFTVIGLDIDKRKLSAAAAGKTPHPDLDGSALVSGVAAKRLVLTADEAALAAADVVVICVPTPLSKSREPDISFIKTAAEQVAAHLHDQMLIILESTTYPGTTREILYGRLAMRGLQVGQDYAVAYSPERIDPGNSTYTLRNTPKVVGGLTPVCRWLAGLFYRQLVDHVYEVSSPEVAEMTKLLENIFRSINIGLVNELAIICEKLGIDVWEVIEAAASKPFGFMKFYPGPGLGGHCIPVDPLYLSWRMRSLNAITRFIELADEINRQMVDHVALQVTLCLNEHRIPLRGARICLVGISYKKNIGDMRESPAGDLARWLLLRGVHLSYLDPYVESWTVDGNNIARYRHDSPESFTALAENDLLVIVTDHDAIDYAALLAHARLIYDCRNAIRSRNLKPARPGQLYTLGLPLGWHLRGAI